MKALLSGLLDFSWILYVACALGAILYAARALALQRRLAGSLTSFERETSASQVVRLWRVAATFVLVGLVLFVGQVYGLPRVLPEGLLSPTPTMVAGLETPQPLPSPSPTVAFGILPTVVPTALPVAPPAPPPPTTAPPDTPTPTVPPSAPSPAFVLEARLDGVAELLGFDLSSTEVVAGQPLLLTLYWRALENAGSADYVVFTHLLQPGTSQIVAQHDGRPVAGTRPTTSWLPGEVIVDTHELVFADVGYSGPAELEVGLYVLGGERVGVEGGGDAVPLPVQVTIVAP